MDNTPELDRKSFKCPRCNTVARQRWNNQSTLGSLFFQILQHNFLDYRSGIQDYQQTAISRFLESFSQRFPRVFEGTFPEEFSISTCDSCQKSSFWVGGEIVFPKRILVDEPNQDLDEDIISLYTEAANILSDSPKGAAALLRLALHKLLIQVGENGKDINQDIKNLVSNGLSPKIQKALDLVRVVGNNAVHPGQIDFKDNRNIALNMFKLLNLVSYEMITKPKEIEELYEDVIPDDTKEHIKKRDGLA